MNLKPSLADVHRGSNFRFDFKPWLCDVESVPWKLHEGINLKLVRIHTQLGDRFLLSSLSCMFPPQFLVVSHGGLGIFP